jgi:Tol biopolymer transport system component
MSNRRGKLDQTFNIHRTCMVSVAILGVCHAGAQSARDSAAAAPDRVAYSTFAPANWDIYLFDRTRAAPRRLTAHPALDYDASVSPNGRWLVFCSERRGNPDLYLLDLENAAEEPRLLIESDALEDQAAFSPDGGSIAFVGTAAGNADVYTVPFAPNRTATMSEARNVTNDPGGDFRPAFSPDGRTIAFSSDRGLPIDSPSQPYSITRLRSGDIYTMDLASTRTKRLTDAPGWDGSPAWSLDGKTIAFYSERGTRLDHTNTALFTMNADGTGQRPIATAEGLGALSPKFLPDGRIVFARRTKPSSPTVPFDEAGGWQLVSTQADGSDPQIESEVGANNYWGPTPGPTAGTLVAYGTGPSASGDAIPVTGAPFRRTMPGRFVDLYPLRANLGTVLHPFEPLVLHNLKLGVDLTVSNMIGTEHRRLVEFAAPRNRPIGFNWSRDGKWIAFSRGGSSTLFGGATDGDVWKMRSDGTELTNLTPDSPEDDGYPTFSGDGQRIVFRRGKPGHYDLYVMTQNGASVRRLTDDGANYLDPAFSPTANRIAFVSNRMDPTSVLYDVYLMELADNRGAESIRRITATEGQEGHVAFSYDGEWVVFASEQGGISDESPLYPEPQAYGEIYAYRIGDGTTVRLTHNKWEEGVPSWEKAVPQH